MVFSPNIPQNFIIIIEIWQASIIGSGNKRTLLLFAICILPLKSNTRIIIILCAVITPTPSLLVFTGS